MQKILSKNIFSIRIAAFLFCAVFLFFGFTAKASAATWYVRPALDSLGNSLVYGLGNGTSYDNAWGTNSVVCGTGGVQPGDIVFIDGIHYGRFSGFCSGTVGNLVYYRPYDVNNLPKIWPSLYIGDSTGVNSSGVITTSSPWTSLGNGVYKKSLGIFSTYLWDGTTLISPILDSTAYDQTEAWMISNLPTGNWASKSGPVIYYKPVSGSTANTRVNGIQFKGQQCGLLISGKSYIDVTGINVYGVYMSGQTGARAGWTIGAGCILDSDHITINSGSFNDSIIGLYISAGDSIVIKPSVVVSGNGGFGIGVDGNGTGTQSNSIISGLIKNNGNNPVWDSTRWSFNLDGDGVGVGYLGGTINNLLISGATILNNGPSVSTAPAWVYSGNTVRGAGVFVGTGFSMVADVSVKNSLIKGNHRFAITLGGPQWQHGNIDHNVITGTEREPGQSTQASLRVDVSTSRLPSSIVNNIFYENKSQGGLGLYTGTDDPIEVKNNVFYNAVSSGSVPGFQYDMHIRQGKTNLSLVEANNVFYRGDSEYMVRVENVSPVVNAFYTMSNFGSYPTAFTTFNKGIGDASYNPNFANVTTGDFTPLIGSNLIDAGTTTNAILTTDTLNNPIYGTPDIGAYEYQPPHLVGTDKIDVNAGARIYGDGKFRDLAATSSVLADLKVTPTAGSFPAFDATTTRPAWMDVSIANWQNTGTYQKTWTESSTVAGLTNTLHTIGDLLPNKYYNVKLDSVLGQNITGANCSNGICLSDSLGKITFTYTGTYSTHTFDITEGDNTPPVRSLGAPSGTLAFGTATSTLSLSTALENATCKYSTTSNVVYAGMTNTFTITGGNTHSQSLTGLTAGTAYNYYVRCIDSFGNINPDDFVISFNIAADTSIPTVVVTSPANFATVSGTINITANAFDLDAVGGVKFYYDSLSHPIGAENTASPYITTLDTTALANGFHTIFATVRDITGNTATSSNVNVTVSNISASGGGSGGVSSPVSPAIPTTTTPPSTLPIPTPTTPVPPPGLTMSQASAVSVRLINDNGTYYLIIDGIKHGITDPGILNSFGFSLSDAVQSTPADDIIPQGILLLPADGALVKSQQDPTVYLVSNQQRYGFTSASVFLGLGFKFSSVLTITNPELEALPKASDLSDPNAAHLPGVSINSQGTVYRVGSDNLRHPYPSLAIYNSWNIDSDFSRVVTANSADLLLPVGESVVGRVVN